MQVPSFPDVLLTGTRFHFLEPEQSEAKEAKEPGESGAVLLRVVLASSMRWG